MTPAKTKNTVNAHVEILFLRDLDKTQFEFPNRNPHYFTPECRGCITRGMTKIKTI